MREPRNFPENFIKKSSEKSELTSTEVEEIKEGIGDRMRTTKHLLKSKENFSALKEYNRITKLYEKIGDKKKAELFYKKVDELRS